MAVQHVYNGPAVALRPMSKHSTCDIENESRQKGRQDDALDGKRAPPCIPLSRRVFALHRAERN